MANTRVTNPVTDFDKSTSLPGLKLPSGTNANQPSGVQGMIRNDTGETTGGSTSAIEHHNGTNWQYFAATESAVPIIPENPYNNVLYTGNGGTKAVTGLGFQPDFVWSKSISTSSTNHILSNVITGTGSNLYSNLTASSGTRGVTSFDTDGFTYSYPAEGGDANFNGQSYVAWCWKAGGAAVANTDGSTASQVSANVAGGFSIVTTAPTAGAITFGHGLDSAPEMIINKGYTSNGWSWLVYHKDIGTGKYLTLNSTASTTNFAGSFSNVTNTTITNASSTSSQTYVNYCFHSVPGYSKVGSYTGNGNNTGPVVNTGFEPSFILIKAFSRTGYWIMLDNKRNTSNPIDNPLYPNTNWAQDTNQTNRVNFDATGFQVVGTGGDVNYNGSTYIYLAFA